MTPRENWIAFITLLRKEVVRFVRIWPQTLVPPIITQSLYFVIFGKFIGSQIRDIENISYMAFIIPGLMMMAVINNSYANVSGSFFSSKFQRSIEELFVASMSHWAIIGGYVVGAMLRGVVVGILVFSISVFFVRPTIHHPVFILTFMILTSGLFSLGGLLNGILAKKFDDISIFPTFVLTPLTYLGGVFYSIHSLPEFAQHLSKLNPIFYMVDGFRFGFYGFSDESVWLSLGILIILNLILMAVSHYVLKKGIGLKT